METVKCSVCGIKIEYTSIVDDVYYLNTAYEDDHKTGHIDLVTRDDLCIECVGMYYEADNLTER